MSDSNGNAGAPSHSVMSIATNRDELAMRLVEEAVKLQAIWFGTEFEKCVKAITDGFESCREKTAAPPAGDIPSFDERMRKDFASKGLDWEAEKAEREKEDEFLARSREKPRVLPELRWNGEFLESDEVRVRLTSGTEMRAKAIQFPTLLPIWSGLNADGTPSRIQIVGVAAWSFPEPAKPACEAATPATPSAPTIDPEKEREAQRVLDSLGATPRRPNSRPAMEVGTVSDCGVSQPRLLLGDTRRYVVDGGKAVEVWEYLAEGKWRLKEVETLEQIKLQLQAGQSGAMPG